MNNYYYFILSAGLLCWNSAKVEAQQTLQVFTNRTEFLEATAATNCTGLLPRLAGVIPGGMLHLGPVTLSAPRFQCSEFTPLLPGGELLITGLENFNADFDEAVTAAGFDFVDTTTGSGGSCPGLDSVFAMTLIDGSTVVSSFSFNAPNDVASFIGVRSPSPFRRVEIRETSGGCENDFFGTVYCRAVPPGPSVGISLRRSEVEICWPSRSNMAYRVEFRSDHSAGMWSPLYTNVVGNGESLCVSDDIGPEHSQRYYRVVGSPE